MGCEDDRTMHTAARATHAAPAAALAHCCARDGVRPPFRLLPLLLLLLLLLQAYCLLLLLLWHTFGRRDRMTSGSISAYAWPFALSGLSPPMSAFWLYSDSPWRVSQILRAFVMPPLHTCWATRGMG